jgi:succinate dehydrogenase/fumarate reductase flavoprotein subunit
MRPRAGSTGRPPRVAIPVTAFVWVRQSGGVVSEGSGAGRRTGACVAGSTCTDGSNGAFPAFDRARQAGADRCHSVSGARFTNEADSYYDFITGLLKVTPEGQRMQAWLVCDHRFIRRYGLGAVKPAPMLREPMLRNGYLQRGNTLGELATACGIDPPGLQGAVARYNRMALAGKDDDFAKGETPYNRIQGDAAASQEAGLPNACMAPLVQAPFYAVKVVVGSLGTFAGLQVNGHAQVIDASGQPIEGLYAGGNDMSSMMGGTYPSGGITLGPAMTFGFIAAHHVAGVEPQNHFQG